MTNEKFELLADQSITVFGITLFRIRARIAFGNVGKDELGGFVEKESNVDTSGNAWVSGDAQVCGDARVYGNARVSGNAQVFGNARISGDAQVCGNAWVSGDAWVYDNAWVSGDARVCGNARVFGNASLVWFSRVGSEHGTLTAFRATAGITVTRGCFIGSLDEFSAAVDEKHGSSQIGAEYRLLIQFIRLRLGDAAEKSEAA